jgi:hypothetical protein
VNETAAASKGSARVDHLTTEALATGSDFSGAFAAPPSDVVFFFALFDPPAPAGLASLTPPFFFGLNPFSVIFPDLQGQAKTVRTQS